MVKKGFIYILILISLFRSYSQESSSKDETNLAGVNQGRPLFIQNPFNKTTMSFCVNEIFINDQRVNIDYKLSALKLDFEKTEKYSPVKIRIVHDTTCQPIIVNSEAILFHTIFRFSEIQLSDSALVWYTKGERGIGEFEIEKLDNGIWIDQEIIKASGKYEGEEYIHYPNLEVGANKYRVKYVFPLGNRVSHLFSQEVEFEFYPEPVEFSPKSVKTKLMLSRSTHYEIYDAGNTLVLEGQGTEIDVRILRRGRYIIYFSGKDPGTFVKE